MRKRNFFIPSLILNSLLLFGPFSAQAANYPASSASGGPGTSGCTGSASCTNESWGVDLNTNTGFRWYISSDAVSEAEAFFTLAVPSQSRAMSLWVNGSRVNTVTTSAVESPRPNGKELGPFSVTLQAGSNAVELRDTEGTMEFDVHKLRIEPKQSTSNNEFEVGLWRLAARNDRRTLSINTGTGQLTGADYTGDTDQQWRLTEQAANHYELRQEYTGQCLISAGGLVALGSCGTSAADWSVETLRVRSEERPALYRLRTAANTCLVGNSTGQTSVGPCDDNARWYVEPVGFGERSAPREYEVHALLLVKPNTNVPGLTQGSLASDVVNAVQVAFENSVAYWLERITDGRVGWQATSQVSFDPITSLTEAGGNYLPAAANLQQDVQNFIPRGVYDTVQVFFTPGNSVPGGWGWGPGSNSQSNYTMWTTVNGAGTSAAQWLSTTASEPAEVFIHEPMHGYDSHYDQFGLPLPEGYLHGGDLNGYAQSKIPGQSWLHWYRDYWLGTVIAADDTYRGYGPRLFRMATPRAYAVSDEVAEYKIVQATSGKCFSTQGGSSTPAYNTPIVLSDICNTGASSFRMLATGMLKHIPSGSCIHPNQGTAYNNTNLILYPSCDAEPRLTFNVTSGGSLRNTETGRCVHPQGGSPYPAEGTAAIFWDGCDEERLRFNIELE